MSTPYNPENGPRRTDGQPATWPAPGWNDTQGFPPGNKPRGRMPWYGWGCLGLAGMFTLLLLALIIAAVVMPPVDTAEPEPVATSQEAEPEPSPTFEALDTEAPADPENDVVEEAGGSEGLRNYNESFDDPAARGDEAGYLNHMLENDYEVYMTTDNEAMLGMGLTVCSALDEGYTTIEILDMIPDTLSVNTQASIVAGSALFLCDEHLAQVEQEVGEESGNI